MIIKQLIKKVNNTELGKTGTHETYVQVPSDWDVSDVFPNAEEVIDFTDKDDGIKYKIRLTIGRERRICGLGQYYRDKDLNAGDEVMFEKRTIGGQTDYFISSRRLSNAILLRKDSKGYEILTPERMCLLTDNTVEKKSGQLIQIVFKQAMRKRNDSPEITNYYDIIVGGNPLPQRFTSKDLIEIEIEDDVAKIKTDFIWKKINFEQEV